MERKIYGGLIIAFVVFVGYAWHRGSVIQDAREAAELAVLRRSFERFLHGAFTQRLVIHKPNDYLVNGSDTVENEASHQPCVLLSGDQLQLVSYDPATHKAIWQVYPRPNAAEYYRLRLNAEYFRQGLDGETCIAPYRFVARPAVTNDLTLELWSMTSPGPTNGIPY